MKNTHYIRSFATDVAELSLVGRAENPAFIGIYLYGKTGANLHNTAAVKEDFCA